MSDAESKTTSHLRGRKNASITPTEKVIMKNPLLFAFLLLI